MKNWDDINDFGHYGIFGERCALYDDVADLLDSCLRSGKPFDTKWHGFKKEIEEMRVSKGSDGAIVVEVWCGMDEFPDLIYDCDGGEDLTDEQTEYVESLWLENIECSTEYSASVSLVPDNVTIESIMKEAEKLASSCNTKLNNAFSVLQSYVNDALKNIRREPQNKEVL